MTGTAIQAPDARDPWALLTPAEHFQLRERLAEMARIRLAAIDRAAFITIGERSTESAPEEGSDE